MICSEAKRPFAVYVMFFITHLIHFSSSNYSKNSDPINKILHYEGGVGIKVDQVLKNNLEIKITHFKIIKI